jgi:hypothetical protein
MASRVIESNIEALGDRPYPKRFTDVLKPAIYRQLNQHFSLSILPTKECLLKNPSFSVLEGVNDYSLLHRQVESFGTFTNDEIPPDTDIFSIKIGDKNVDLGDRDECSVHTSAEMITILNPPARAGRQPKRSVASRDECFMFRDNAYMYLTVGRGLAGSNSYEDIRHIHHFIADPHTDPHTDLTDVELGRTLWFDTQQTAAIFVNGGQELFTPVTQAEPVKQSKKRALHAPGGNNQRFPKKIQNCEFVVEYETQSRSGGKRSPPLAPPRPKCITLRSLSDFSILKGSELLANY